MSIGDEVASEFSLNSGTETGKSIKCGICILI